MDKLIRDLLINVKQQGAAKVTKSIQEVVNALEDAAVGAELTNTELSKMIPTLALIEKNARRTSVAMGSLNSKNVDKMTASLMRMEDFFDELLTQSTVMTERMEAGFKTVSKAVLAMGNDVAASVEKTEDQIIGLNAVVSKSSTAFAGTTDSARKASRAIGDTSGSARGATRDFAAMAKIGGSLPIMYAAIASNVFVLQSAFEQLKLGDQLNRLEQFGTIVGAQTGTPVQTLAASLQDAVGYAISFEEAMRQASSASAYGFDSKQLQQFGLVARRAAAVLGVDMTDALNRVIKGVSKQEIELLDELGVTIRLNDAYANYVKQLNAANSGIQYNVNSLSTFQKQQAYANEVIAESTRRFGYLDQVLRATPWEQFAANADSALRRIQQAAAKYLSPVIASINAAFYTSQAEISAEAGRAQKEANSKVDPTNTGAVALSLSASEEGYNKALDMYKEALDKRDKMKAEYDKRLAQADFSTKGAIRLVQQGAPIGASTIGASDENKQFVAYTANLGLELSKLNKEVEDSTVNLTSWRDALNSAGKVAGKADSQFQKSIGLTQGMTGEDPGATIDFNSQVLKGFTEQYKAYDQIKKTSKDLVNDLAAVATNTNTAAKTSQSLESTLSTIETISGGNVAKADAYVKSLNLGYDTLSQMKDASKALSGYVKSNGDESARALAVQQKIADVYAKTGDKAKAEAAGRALEVQQIDQQISALRQLQSTDKENKSIQIELNKLETQKLQTQNQGMETAKKIKDVSDKIVGIEEQIALTKDNVMNSDQYSLATMELQLKIERDRQAILAGNAQKQKELMQSKLQEAQLERQLREANFSILDAQSKRTRDQDAAMRNATLEYGAQEALANQILDLERERLELIENSRKSNVALDTNRALDLQNQVKVLNKQLEEEKNKTNRGYQNTTTNLLGGTYSSIQGMSPENKTIQNYINNQQGYAEAISNLQAINSEATATAQSLGNAVNAMMQFSKGGIDATTLAAAGMQSISSMVTMATSKQVSAIDAAIQAEQARDGQSEESKAKIKKLEAEKVKVQQESAKKQILIQTAVAVMQAATSVPYPWSIPLMIAAAGAGALALSQASSATPQLDGLSSNSSSTASLTLGKRDNSIDVSRGATGGEVSYIRGEKGVGNSNTFVPRAEGGNMIPGVGYIAGENGIEVITPSVPSTATPINNSDSPSGNAKRPIHLTIQAMDAKSFMDFASNNQEIFRNTVESALNEQGLSLRTLNQN